MLAVDGVSRRFGERTVLDDVTFDVVPGRLTGFVGANGAGKTTTMRIIMGVLAPSGGTVRWAGQEVTAADRRSFGYMPEERGLYPKSPVAEQLVYFARLHQMTAAAAIARVDELLERLSLGERAKDRLDSLSLGKQQRVQIAAALVHSPTALVLDEPFSGLDPLAVDAMADLLDRQVRAGVPVLFSSHQLDLVERICDDLVILADGRVVAAGAADDLRASAGVLYRLVLGDGQDAGWLRDVPGLGVADVDGSAAVVDVQQEGAEQELLHAALARGPVREFARVVPALSDIFREAVR